MNVSVGTLAGPTTHAGAGEAGPGAGHAAGSSSLDYAGLAELACPGRGCRIAASFPRACLLVAASPEELAAAGVDRADAERLMAAFELTRRARLPGDQTVRITSAEAAAEALMPHLIDAPCERVAAIALDKRCTVIATVLVAEGGLDRAQIDPRVLFGKLLRIGAVATVLGHTHPSGDPEPSSADVRTTSRLAEAAALLDIDLLDHVVIAGDRWVSMKEAGLM